MRKPCCEKEGINKGAWSKQEDQKLIDYIKTHGEGCWRSLPQAAGLHRCGKSCRLRWINYLRPDIKRGNFAQDEEDLIIKLHALLGNRWSLIAGRLPGRTDNEVKNYWNSHIRKKLVRMGIDPNNHKPQKHQPPHSSNSDDDDHQYHQSKMINKKQSAKNHLGRQPTTSDNNNVTTTATSSDQSLNVDQQSSSLILRPAVEVVPSCDDVVVDGNDNKSKNNHINNNNNNNNKNNNDQMMSEASISCIDDVETSQQQALDLNLELTIAFPSSPSQLKQFKINNGVQQLASGTTINHVSHAQAAAAAAAQQQQSPTLLLFT